MAHTNYVKVTDIPEIIIRLTKDALQTFMNVAEYGTLGSKQAFAKIDLGLALSQANDGIGLTITLAIK
ncbi:hypothetical protein [Lentilitoribacter sp. Alg239-R112]|uniref:hypothetical protein n=1 Tax=Lentilitoribacter sp. Alg239-R112 TaxID=2305987 RepID=UPI0013A6DCAF|nr:hypothetical protein [Lentilitoribacter sp. Alg239-R112]